MGKGKRLAVLFCCACATFGLLLIPIAAPALSNLVFSSTGTPICLPGLSIKCYQSDCGDYYMRCGSNALLEVPVNQVCYQGRLLPARRGELHQCPSTNSRNSTQNLIRGGSLRGCPSCKASCPGTQSCSCLCGYNVGGQGRVYCSNNGKVYPSQTVANCCGGTGCKAQVMSAREWLLEMLMSALQQFTGLIAFFLDSFTFQTPTVLDGCQCSFPGTCASVC